MITWTPDSPSVISFSGTNGAGLTETFTLTRAGAGPAFIASLVKNGTNQGSITFDTLDIVKDLFGTVANSLDTIL